MSTIRVMSWNLLRQEWAREGWPDWTERAGAIAEVLQSSAPDVVAVQEETPHMAEDLVMRLRNYGYRSVPPEPQSGSGLLVRTDRVEVLGTDRVALPHDRAVTLLKVRVNGVRFWVGSTHFTPFPERIADRTRSAGLLAAWSAARRLPLVVMGDFNSLPRDPALQVLLEAGFRDACTPPGEALCEWATAMDHPEEDTGWRLDYLMIRGGWTVRDAGPVPAPPTASDHRPLFADLVLHNG